jgi:hypothetical protein
MPWGVSAFMNLGADYEIFDYLEHAGSADATDPVLLDRIKFFVEEPRDDDLAEVISDLTGNAGRRWRVDDFSVRPPRKKARDDWDDDVGESGGPQPGAINLSRLIHEFVGYLRRKVANELLPLHATLSEIWQRYHDDPALQRQAQAWPAGAAKGPAVPLT